MISSEPGCAAQLFAAGTAVVFLGFTIFVSPYFIFAALGAPWFIITCAMKGWDHWF